MRYCIKKREDIEHFEFIEQEYNKQSNTIFQLKREIKDNSELICALKNKLSKTGATVFAIEKDKNDSDSFICIQDNRKPYLDYESKNCYMKGEVNLFVISKEIYSIGTGGCIIDMPYLMAEFYKDSVEIVELHSDVRGDLYENKGYGTMLIETLKTIARQSDCKSIYGKLSWVDADTDKKRDKRNGFYQHRGFEVEFNDSKQETGSIHLSL